VDFAKCPVCFSPQHKYLTVRWPRSQIVLPSALSSLLNHSSTRKTAGDVRVPPGVVVIELSESQGVMLRAAASHRPAWTATVPRTGG